MRRFVPILAWTHLRLLVNAQFNLTLVAVFVLRTRQLETETSPNPGTHRDAHVKTLLTTCTDAVGGQTQAPCITNLPKTLPRTALVTIPPLMFRLLLVKTQNVTIGNMVLPTATDMDTRLRGTLENRTLTLRTELIVIFVPLMLFII